MYNYWIIGILLVGDMIAGSIAFNFLFGSSINGSFLLTIQFWTIHFFWMLLFYFANFYNTKATLSRFEEILRLMPLVYFTLVIYMTLDIFQFIQLNMNYRDLLTYGFIFSTAVLFNRLVIHSFQKLFLQKRIGLNNTLILGANRRGLDVFNTLNAHTHHGLKTLGFIKAEEDPPAFKKELPLPILGDESNIHHLIDENKVNDIIIALDRPNPQRVMNAIVNMNGAPISLKVLPDMYEVVTGMARTNQLVGIPLIDIDLNIETLYSKRLKRIFDLTIAVSGIVLLMPIWLLIGLAIKINSKGPIFYKQKRCGLNGEQFDIYKFRSMVVNAEEKTGPIWADIRDERITKIGFLLRRFHLDETPQLLNILKGEMSCIGPRPERPFFVEKLKEEYTFYQRRLKIRPGVTGWAQIKQPFDLSIQDVHQKLKYDFFYIENMSFRLDVKIIINTIWVVFWGHSR